MESAGDEAPALTVEPATGPPSDKKLAPRKRMRKLFASIREQMEFYFSDSNLRRDRYLRKEIEQGMDGYVPLSLFQKFNKMKAISTDPIIIAKALRKCSHVLEVSEDGQRVRRRAPVPNESQTDIDSRTVYVECLPKHVDHDWVKTVFGGFGRIAYISLPRWKTSGDPKGFTFIEFEAADDAQKCCEAFQGSGDFGTAHCFPKGSKQLLQLQRRAAAEDVQIELLTSLPTPSDVTMIADEAGAAEKDDEAVTTRHNPKRKRKKAKFEEEEEDDDDDNRGDEQNPNSKACSQRDGPRSKMRRMKDCSGSVKIASAELSASTTSADGATDVLGLDSDEAEAREVGDPAGNVRDSNVTDFSHRDPHGDDSTTSSEDETEQGKKSSRRNRKKRKSKKMKADKSEHQLELDMLKLKVISKFQWLRLRSEYLSLQKMNMAVLKRALKLPANSGKPSEKSDRHADARSGSCEEEATAPAVADSANQKPSLQPIEFVPDVIVKVTCTKETTTHKSVKASVPADVEVAYIDLADGASNGFIRCKTQASAKQLCSAGSIGDLLFTALRGSEEQAYWSKLHADREQKRSQRRSGAAKKKLRGTQKIAAKAEKITAGAMIAAAGSADATATAGNAVDSRVSNRHTRF